MRPCASDLREQRVEALLDERIEAGDGLVEDQELGLVHERLDEAELLAVAGRELAQRPVELGVEAVDELVAHPPVDAAAELCQVVEHRRTRELRVEREVAGQEPDPAADLEAVARGCRARGSSRARRSA